MAYCLTSLLATTTCSSFCPHSWGQKLDCFLPPLSVAVHIFWELLFLVSFMLEWELSPDLKLPLYSSLILFLCRFLVDYAFSQGSFLCPAKPCHLLHHFKVRTNHKASERAPVLMPCKQRGGTASQARLRHWSYHSNVSENHDYFLRE